MTLYVAAYDIADNRIRRSVSKLLLRWGDRVQKSVFELRLDEGEIDDVLRLVGSRLGRDDDFDLFPVDERHRGSRLSWQDEPYDWQPVRLL